MEAEAAPSQPTPSSALRRPSFLLLFPAAALAGAAALSLEMLWIRGLGRGVGTSHESLAAVAGVFLGGLGLGAAVGATRAVRSERPAMAAAIALVIAGLLAWMGPLYVGQVPALHDALLDALGLEGDGGAAAAFLLVLPLVLPAAFLFGFSFPFLVRACTYDVRHAGGRTGWIYALNTLGSVVAVVGTVLLLARLGEAHTMRVAGAAALGAALLLLMAHRPLPHGSGPPTSAGLGQGSAAGGEGIALLVSGAAALMAQLAWFRMLQPFAGSHLWGVALLLAPLLFSLAIGAAFGGWLSDRVQRSETWLPILLVLAGVCTFLSLPLAGNASIWLLDGMGEATPSRITDLVQLFLMTTGPAAFFFGAALPAAVRVRADATGTAADAAGRIYAWNALGAVLGSMLAGSFLLPHLGAERVLAISGCLPLIAAAGLRWRIPGVGRMGFAALHMAPLLLVIWPGAMGALLSTAPTLPEVIATRKPLPPGCTLPERADVDVYAVWFAGTRAARPGDASGTPLPAYEGRAGRITLLEEPEGVVGLRRGALRESVFDPDQPNRPSLTEYALGALPTLMHPGAKSALVIGHGAGWTVEAVLAAEPEHVDVAELDPAVLEAARAYRGLAELPVERSERATLCTCDGRILLRRAAGRRLGARYDLVVSQPSHPWTPASGHLFSEEAFALSRAALNEGGILAQWLNLFDMTPALLRSALASFRGVFDHVWVFRFSGELVLMGFTAPPQVDVASWEAAFAEDRASAALARAAGYRTPGSLWRHFALDTVGLDSVIPAGTATLHDDKPVLELELAWRRLILAAPEDAEAILGPGFPPRMTAALPQTSARERWLSDAVHAWLDAGRFEEAEAWSRSVRWSGGALGKIAQARAAMASGNPKRATVLLEAAVRMEPERGDLAARWITAAAELVLTAPADVKNEQELVRTLLERFPEHGDVLAAAARLERSRGRVEISEDLFERSLEATEPPAPPGTKALLARLLLSRAFDGETQARATELLSEDPSTYESLDSLDHLLRLRSQQGDEERAQAVEAAFFTLQQSRGLAALRETAGLLSAHRWAEALQASRHCRTIWPRNAAVFELDALVTLCLEAARKAGLDVPVAVEGEALQSFRDAVKRSKTPDAMRARARRMLIWFGKDPALLTESEDD